MKQIINRKAVFHACIANKERAFASKQVYRFTLSPTEQFIGML